MTNEISATCDAEVSAPRGGLLAGVWVWTLIGSIAFGAAGHMLIKFGVVNLTKHVGKGSEQLLTVQSLPLLAGLSIYLVGTLFWMLTVSRKELSFLYPLTSLTYVIVVAGGYFVFHESVPFTHWLGLAVIVCGVALMQVSPHVD